MNYPDLIWRLVEMLLQNNSNQQVATNSDNKTADAEEQE